MADVEGEWRRHQSNMVGSGRQGKRIRVDGNDLCGSECTRKGRGEDKEKGEVMK